MVLGVRLQFNLLLVIARLSDVRFQFSGRHLNSCAYQQVNNPFFVIYRNSQNPSILLRALTTMLAEIRRDGIYLRLAHM